MTATESALPTPSLPRGLAKPGGLWRNASFAWQFLLMAGAGAVLAALACLVSGAAAGAWSLAGAAVSCALFATFSRMRYREISQLAAEMDEVLHGGRRVAFSDCREGDVAILRSEVSKMVARLQRTSEQLQREKTALADALADVSHQIRTPLTAMSLLVPVAERARDEQARSRTLRELESMVERVSWLVTTLLKLARFDSGAMAFEKRPVRVADAVRRALEPLELSFDVRGVDCQVKVGDAAFEGDEMWTAEAVENIAKNCAEAAGPGGAVRIEAEEDALSTRIRISDDGPGIAPEDLPHIFERFYRGRRGAAREGSACEGGDPAAFDNGDPAFCGPAACVTDNPASPQDAEGCGAWRNGSAADDPAAPQGFGIGLSLAQALVSAQGGSLRARNLTQGGACFEITFPKMNV